MLRPQVIPLKKSTDPPQSDQGKRGGAKHGTKKRTSLHLSGLEMEDEEKSFSPQILTQGLVAVLF